MRAWRRQLRFGIIALASFVLLVTVLPQVASAVGFGSLANRLATSVSCTGGSGSGSSSQCTPTPGTVTGTVTITGAPAGFVPPYSGAGACPGSLSTLICADPVYSLASGGRYSLQLSPGTWTVDGFFEIKPYGGAFLGSPRVVTVTSGHVFTRNLTVPYAMPARLTGTITVTGAPKGITIQSLSVLLCPPGAPYTGGPASIACVNGYGRPSAPGSTTGTFTVSGLPPVKWLAYPGYCTEFGCTIAQQGIEVVTLLPGKTTTLDLSASWTTPQNGLLTGSVTVTGAPAGFSAAVGVWACNSQGTGQICEGYSSGTNSFGLILPNGTWQVTGFYFAAPFNNAIVGPTSAVVIRGGKTTTATLSVPYRVLGAAAGSITVTGLPASVHPTGYTVTACPAATTPLTGLECVQEFSGVGGLTFGIADPNRLSRSSPTAGHLATTAGGGFNVYRLPTLTAGKWILHAGYQTAFGTFTNPTGVTVTITSGQTTTENLSVPFQVPTLGLVTGTVAVTGAPEYGYQAGARACTADPTTVCAGERDAYLNQNGTYQLLLTPGTWWVSGLVYVYGSGPTSTEVVSAPRKVVIVAGARVTEQFVVAVS